MRWSDERFVKVYTRDTPDLLALGWEARALLWELLRKVDRAGIFELGKSGNRGLAVVTGIPVEVVDRALPILIQDGCVESHGRHLLVRSFIEAQEAKQSDKARQQKCRESDRDKARRDSALQSHGVTEEEKLSRNDVTPRDENSESVTTTASDVTLRLEETIQTRNSLPRDPSAGTTEHAAQRPTGHSLCFLFGRLRREVLQLQCPPGAENPSDANGKAASFAERMDPSAFADVEPTMRAFLLHLKRGDEGWNADPGNASLSFGAWRDRFGDLRAELSGGTPKVATRKQQQQQQKQSAWMPPEI